MIRSLFSCQRGNSFVELAFVAPMLVTLLLGMVDISRAYSAKLQLVQASQRAIERVQRSGFQYSDLATVKSEAETAAGSGSSATATAWLECGSSTARLSFTATCADGQAYARFVNVSVTRGFTPIVASEYFPGAGAGGTYTIEASSGVRIQ